MKPIAIQLGTVLLGAALMASALMAGALMAAPAVGQDLSGHWEGEITIPGQPLAIKVDLSQSGEEWAGSIDIPMQGAKGLALAAFDVSREMVEFQISGVPGTPTFVGTFSDDRIEGDFKQAGATMKFWLGRETLAGPNRPQEPKPPFPYREEEVAYENGAVGLAGTLTLPPGEGPFPAALLITGSGPQDRDEALMGHRPFWVLADHLTRAGIAVLRVDDRGVGGSSGGSVMESTSADFATDVTTGVEFLKADARIREIGVIGHSEGGVVGPMAAALSEDIAFVVMMAGTGVPGSAILIEQLELIARAQGATDEMVASSLELQRRAIAIISGDGPRDQRKEQMRVVVNDQLAASPETAALSGQEREEAIDQAVAGALNPWFEAFVKLDPRIALRQVEVPVLVLNGNLDLQVDADQNLGEIAKALMEGGNKDVTIRRFDKLNHLFQTATTGSPSEYAAIEETIAPVVLDTMSDWILDRFGEP